MTDVQHINPATLASNPAFTQVVRVPAGSATIYVGGQNGIDGSGKLAGPGLAAQTRQALANLSTCLDAAGASLTDVVKWTILCVEGQPLGEGLAAFGEAWGRRPNPPAITVAMVSGLAVPGAVVEIDAVAVA